MKCRVSYQCCRNDVCRFHRRIYELCVCCFVKICCICICCSCSIADHSTYNCHCLRWHYPAVIYHRREWLTHADYSISAVCHRHRKPFWECASRDRPIRHWQLKLPSLGYSSYRYPRFPCARCIRYALVLHRPSHSGTAGRYPLEPWLDGIVNTYDGKCSANLTTSRAWGERCFGRRGRGRSRSYASRGFDSEPPTDAFGYS